jgi:hypothetical protein
VNDAARHGRQEFDAHRARRIRLLDDGDRGRSRPAAEARDLAKHVVERHEREAEAEHRHADGGDFDDQIPIGCRAHRKPQPPTPRRKIQTM